MIYKNVKKGSARLHVESLEGRALLAVSGVASVQSFTLINADTDQPIAEFQSLTDGAVLDLANLPTRNLNIRANTTPGRVGSVKFRYDGTAYTKIESTAPYALTGDDQGDYRAWTPMVGTHTLTATPYRRAGAEGRADTPLTIRFTVRDSGGPATAPAAPTGLVAGAVSPARFDLAWADNSSDETGFVIERQDGVSGTFSALATVAADLTRYSDTSVAPGSPYTYRVMATNAAGQSAYSNAVTVAPSTEQDGGGELGELPPAIAGEDYHLAFSDEFSGSSIDTNKWHLGGPWGETNSVQTGAPNSYTPKNVSVSDGAAHLLLDTDGKGKWKASILNTDTTFTFLYGYVEVRAQVPKGKGLWPAIWLYNVDNKSEEIDIMEFLGGDPGRVYQTNHYYRGSKQFSSYTDDWSAAYHTYAVKWSPSEIIFYIDGEQKGRVTSNISNRKMYLMINNDAGDEKSWGGSVDATTPTSNRMNVDYVRIYQK